VVEVSTPSRTRTGDLLLEHLDDVLGRRDGVVRLIDTDRGPAVVGVGATGFKRAERASDLAADYGR
jgi:hypothetical protein